MAEYETFKDWSRRMMSLLSEAEREAVPPDLNMARRIRLLTVVKLGAGEWSQRGSRRAYYIRQAVVNALESAELVCEASRDGNASHAAGYGAAFGYDWRLVVHFLLSLGCSSLPDEDIEILIPLLRNIA